MCLPPFYSSVCGKIIVEHACSQRGCDPGGDRDTSAFIPAGIQAGEGGAFSC